MYTNVVDSKPYHSDCVTLLILIVLITLDIFCHIQIKNHDNGCLCNLFSILVMVVNM